MGRLSDLAGWLARHAGRPVIYGRDDCARFVAGWVALRTGVDPGAGIRYTTPRGGMRVLRRAGGAEALATRYLVPVAPIRARAGDVCLLDQEGEAAFGIVGTDVVHVRVADGLAAVPRARIAAAWSVG